MLRADGLKVSENARAVALFRRREPEACASPCLGVRQLRKDMLSDWPGDEDGASLARFRVYISPHLLRSARGLSAEPLRRYSVLWDYAPAQCSGYRTHRRGRLRTRRYRPPISSAAGAARLLPDIPIDGRNYIGKSDHLVR